MPENTEGFQVSDRPAPLLIRLPVFPVLAGVNFNFWLKANCLHLVRSSAIEKGPLARWPIPIFFCITFRIFPNYFILFSQKYAC